MTVLHLRHFAQDGESLDLQAFKLLEEEKGWNMSDTLKISI